MYFYKSEKIQLKKIRKSGRMFGDDENYLSKSKNCVLREGKRVGYIYIYGTIIAVLRN